MTNRLKILLLALFGVVAGCSEHSAPQEVPVSNSGTVVEMGTPENYCVVYCYIRVPFTIAKYDVSHKIGRVFCDFDTEVTSRLPIYNGEARTKNLQATPIGVFKNEMGKATGDVEMSTGVIKQYFVSAKVKSVHCHL
jgi:hypothetical protein